MGLSTAERTGSPVLHTLWLYVPERSSLVPKWDANLTDRMGISFTIVANPEKDLRDVRYTIMTGV
jgi:hypothetical protein